MLLVSYRSLNKAALLRARWGLRNVAVQRFNESDGEAIAAPVVLKAPLGSHPRIGYAPYSPTLTPPGDRRRFVSYARKRNLPFEIADPNEKYDLVVLSELADISVWPDYPHGKMVYDLIDSYLSVPRTKCEAAASRPRLVPRRKEPRFQIDFLSGIQNICRRSDAVVCSAPEQRKVIEEFCENVHVILDFQAMVVGDVKSDFSAHTPFRLGWEGLPSNLTQLDPDRSGASRARFTRSDSACGDRSGPRAAKWHLGHGRQPENSCPAIFPISSFTIGMSRPVPTS